MKYMKLDQKGNAMAEYIWIDSAGGVRSKSRVRNFFAFLIFAPNCLGFHYLIPSCHYQKPGSRLLGSAATSTCSRLSLSCPPPKRPSVVWHARNFEGYRAWPAGLLWFIVMVSPASSKEG